MILNNMILMRVGCFATTSVLIFAAYGCGSRSTPSLAIPAQSTTTPADAHSAAITPTENSAGAASANVAQSAHTQADVATDPAAVTAKGHPKQWWEAVYAYGTRIGWMHTAMTDVTVDGQRAIQIDNENKLVVDREGQRTAISISTRSLELPTGEPISFTTEMNSGASRTVMNGRITEGKLIVETKTQGKTTKQALPWTPGTLGFSATEQSLAAAPLLPGSRRTLKALMPATNQVVIIDLVAGTYEPTQLLDHSEDLLRIDSLTTLPMSVPDDHPPVLRQQLWCDRQGQMLKTSLAALHQETFRAARIGARRIGTAKTGFGSRQHSACGAASGRSTCIQAHQVSGSADRRLSSQSVRHGSATADRIARSPHRGYHGVQRSLAAIQK